ncbi:hypothetical protein [Hymenobacter chitinivorans]|uniref:hypothetical protein n=1 Tax=Hymenobacter chitinivorans TaxID=89969 RepID=UPI0012FE1E46|nr:hypothetical protein [Hymenobacter chitinivorans]
MEANFEYKIPKPFPETVSVGEWVKIIFQEISRAYSPNNESQLQVFAVLFPAAQPKLNLPGCGWRPDELGWVLGFGAGVG